MSASSTNDKTLHSGTSNVNVPIINNDDINTNLTTHISLPINTTETTPKNNDDDDTSIKSSCKNCKTPFSGWGGPLQVPAKIIFTVGDFFGCVVAIAFIFHILILLGTHGTAKTTRGDNYYVDPNQTMSTTPNKLTMIYNYISKSVYQQESNTKDEEEKYGAVSVSLVFMWLFGLNFANLAIIPVFVFTRFSYFRKGGGPFQPVLRAIYSPLTRIESNKYTRQFLGIFYFIYFVLFLIYSIGAFLYSTSWGFNGLDKLLLGVVVIIPLLRIILATISYSIHAWISFFYSITCNKNRLIRLNPKNEELQQQNANIDNNVEHPNAIHHLVDKINIIKEPLKEMLNADHSDSDSDHENMNTIHSITFDGAFESPFDYVPKFARADPFLYSIYGQSTLCSWHCTPDGKTNSWSAMWELYHIIIAVSTDIYIINAIAQGEECTRNCWIFLIIFLFFITPLTIRVRFPFYVLHSAFSCIPKIDEIFNCFGVCAHCLKCKVFQLYGCGCDCNSKCQRCITSKCNKCCNRTVEEDDSEYSFEDIYLHETNENGFQYEDNLSGDEEPANKKKYENFELLALSSNGFGVMSAVIYLFFISMMLLVTVFILSNFKFNKRMYRDYPLNVTNYNKLLENGSTLSYGLDIPPMSQICNAHTYGLTMLQYIALCDLAYYDIFSNEAKVMINDFFNTTSQITINKMGHMDFNKYKFGSMTYFNIDQLNLTVVAIRGSTEGIDWALDIQFFLSSGLLTISIPLNIFTRDTTPRTTTAIKTILAAPLNLLYQYTLFHEFYKDMNKYIEEEIPMKQNIIFVGHSLGGALAKLFGHVKGNAAISVSGPGITLFQTIMEGKRKDIYSILSEVDIVPDGDLVPRVDESAATKYRILCNQGFATCHSIQHTLCMTGIMCGTPHEFVCKSLENSPIPSIYDRMFYFSTEESE